MWIDANFVCRTGISDMYNTVDELAKDGGRKIGNPGRRVGVRIVGTESDLNAIWAQYSQGGTPITGTTYPGLRVAFSDGSEIAIRSASKTGGPTIDVLGANGESVKIHVEPWPPVAAGAKP